MPGVKFMNGGRSQAEWGSYLEPKFGIVEALKQQLRSFTPDKAKQSEWGDGWVLVSFLTDPYTPAEATHRLTRQCLELLLEAGHKVRVQTRSALVERDFDLLAAHKDRVLLGTSLPHLDSVLTRALEPRAPAPRRRLQMLQGACARGIPVYVAIAPFLPFHDECVLTQVAGEIAAVKPREVFCEVLNPKGENLGMMHAALAHQHSHEAGILERYTAEQWARFTHRILSFGHQNISQFIPWPDTMRGWAKHLSAAQSEFLDKFLPEESTVSVTV